MAHCPSPLHDGPFRRHRLIEWNPSGHSNPKNDRGAGRASRLPGDAGGRGPTCYEGAAEVRGISLVLSLAVSALRRRFSTFDVHNSGTIAMATATSMNGMLTMKRATVHSERAEVACSFSFPNPSFDEGLRID